MRTLILALSVLLVSSNIQASNNSLLQKLAEVNAQWLNQPEQSAVLQNAALNNPKTFNDWIAAHLMLVEQTLRSRDISDLSATQQNNRLRLLNELNGYWHTRAFPVNNYTTYKTPVFIDKTGNHCAVGYLMQQSGAEGLAQQISAEQKFAYVHQIKVAGIKQWADANGFTVDELAWIQPGYPPTTITNAMDSGFNATVNVITVDPINQTIYAGGEFTHASTGVACNHVAAWISGIAGYDWISVGTGVNGNVHAMIIQNNKLYVGGEFTTASGSAASRVAVYDIGLGQWQAIGAGLDSTVRALCFYKGNLFAGGDFTGNLSKWTGTSWQDVSGGMITGSVRTMEVWNDMIAIGGKFDLATGAPRKNAAAFDGAYVTMLGMGTPTPVNDFTLHLGKLYAACDLIELTDTCALAIYDTTMGNWQIVLRPFDNLISSGFGGNAIKSIISFGDKLVAAGDFNCGWGMTFGNNLMAYSQMTQDTITYNVCMPYLQTNKAVNSIAIVANQLYFGGEFTVSQNNGVGNPSNSKKLNHIGYLALGPVSGNEKNETQISLRVYPNPANDVLRIETSADNQLQHLEIFDITGKSVYVQQVFAQAQNVSLNHLAQGVYTVKALTADGWGTARVVKQ